MFLWATNSFILSSMCLHCNSGSLKCSLSLKGKKSSQRQSLGSRVRGDCSGLLPPLSGTFAGALACFTQRPPCPSPGQQPPMSQSQTRGQQSPASSEECPRFTPRGHSEWRSSCLTHSPSQLTSLVSIWIQWQGSLEESPQVRQEGETGKLYIKQTRELLEAGGLSGAT